MLFNSLKFAIFLTIVFFVYWAIPHKYRWIILLTANCYFYLCFDFKYFLILLFNIFFSYLFGIILEKHKQKLLLIITIIICLSSLLVTKYLNFSIKILSDLGLMLNDSSLKVLLPVGISFYTFEIVSYLVDVYKNEVKAEKHLGYYAIYISFFPTISSGPIERANKFLSQIKEEKTFDYGDGSFGLKLIAWGLFKKIVVADNLAIFVDKIYTDLPYYEGFILVLIAVFYAIQIYCDFSGYSDMARGISKLLGFEINKNFKVPYFSTTIKEFWSKWHISLTDWLRDYIYIPLGGNRRGVFRRYLNILIVFLVSGLWHGANYTFIIWGLLHAILQIIESIFDIKPVKEKNFIYWLRVLFIFVIITFTWIFFRADNLNDALYFISNMFNGIGNIRNYIVSGLYSFDIKPFVLIMRLFVYLLPLLLVDSLIESNNISLLTNNKSSFVRYILYFLLIIIILLFHNVGTVNYIYFKF